MLGLGGILLAAGTVIGRPYCRFLCPYGALLRVASLASKWRVRVTPDTCTQCRLCEQSCPYGAMREPAAGAMDAAALGMERRRLGWLLLLIPVWIGAGGWLGSGLSIPASQLHPAVALAERYVRQQKQPVPYGPQTAEALSLRRAAENPEAVFKAAADLRRRFVLAGWLFGGWTGLVIGIKLITLSVRPARTDFEPDRGACVGCARCFEYCPSERVRRGELPSVLESMPLPAATGGTKA